MPEKKSLKLQAYDDIKRKIIDCEYAPGMLLNEEALHDEMHVSRTPIRDALSRLEQEGLITIIPKKGIAVSNLSIDDVNMIFEVRMLYEPYALKNYGALLKSEQILQFYNDFSMPEQVFTTTNYFELDDAFHAAIIQVIPNRYLLKTYDWIHNQNLRFRVMTGNVQSHRLQDTSKEHLRIVSAALKQDWALAAAEMEEHLRLSKNATFDLLLKQK